MDMYMYGTIDGGMERWDVWRDCNKAPCTEAAAVLDSWRRCASDTLQGAVAAGAVRREGACLRRTIGRYFNTCLNTCLEVGDGCLVVKQAGQAWHEPRRYLTARLCGGADRAR